MIKSLPTKIFALTSAVALSLYAYLGAFIRPLGDDYCISARLIGYNVFFASLAKYLTTSNRFSNQFVAWFSDLFGPRGVAVLAVTMLLLWLVGLTWLLAEAARLFQVRWELWTGFLLAELVALVSYYTAPNLFQSVQWRPGLMTYFMPLVLYSFIFAGLLRGIHHFSGRAAKRTETSGTIILLFFAAFFTGGLSETVGAFHISVLGLALVVNFFWNKGPTRRAALVLLTATLAGALVAMFAMFITPANAMRLDDTVTPSLVDVIQRSLTFAAQFLAEAARLLIIPSAFALLSGALLAYLFANNEQVSLPRLSWLGLLIIPALTYLLTVAMFAPSAYGQSFPVERVRFPAHVLLTASLLTEGGLLGLLALRLLRSVPRWTTALAFLALLVVALYPLWTVRNNLRLVPAYQTRAAQWDTRDARIRELAASGERDLVVWGLPGVADVNDLGPRPDHWINYCAAIYYGVDTISASQENPSP